MKDQNLDRPVRKHIEELVEEEHRLHEQRSLSDPDHRRPTAIKVELDQCWEPAVVVEKYEG
jgi:hypothetical protein